VLLYLGAATVLLPLIWLLGLTLSVLLMLGILYSLARLLWLARSFF
jgi:hypothetical protein